MFPPSSPAQFGAVRYLVAAVCPSNKVTKMVEKTGLTLPVYFTTQVNS